MRVRTRTRELAAVNESLVVEVSERMQTEQSLEASRRELKQLAAQLLRAQEEERRRISRDLHDDVNQRLALLAMEIEGVERQVSSPTYQIGNALRGLQVRVAELSEDVRHLAYKYHSSILDDLGLPIAMQRLVDDFVARTNIQGTLVCRNIPEHLPQDVATCLYRVAQESLNNVMRHAKASHVDVDLAWSKQDLTMTIADNGAGFAFELSRNGTDGLGLLSMKERIAGVDGTLHIESAIGKGTHVKAVVPLEEET
jgi:signal transduction histidine kinase